LPELGFRLVARVEQSSTGIARLDTTSDGQLYATFDRAVVYRLEGNAWVLVADDAPAEIVGINDAGRIWAASPNLAAAWDGDAWTEYGPEAGWLFPVGTHWDLLSDFMSASDGTVWMATDQDVRAFDGKRWRVYTYADMMMEPVYIDDYIRSTFSLAEANGVIWVGECTNNPLGPVGGAGARWFDGQSWHGADSPAATGCVTEIAIAPDGVVWLDVGPTLYGYDPAADNWNAYRLPTPPDGFARFGYVTDMLFDAGGDLWLEMSTCGPCHCYTTFPRYHFERASGAFHRVISGMEDAPSILRFDATGQGWRFAIDGVHRLEGDHFELVGDARISDYIPVIQTLDGDIWAICTAEGNRGLWLLPVE
jgi:hypothetical protein